MDTVISNEFQISFPSMYACIKVPVYKRNKKTKTKSDRWIKPLDETYFFEIYININKWYTKYLNSLKHDFLWIREHEK